MKRIMQALTQGEGQDKVMGSRERAMETKEEGLSYPRKKVLTVTENLGKTKDVHMLDFRHVGIQLQIGVTCQQSEPDNTTCHCEIVQQIDITVMLKRDAKHRSNTEEGVSNMALKQDDEGFSTSGCDGTKCISHEFICP